MLKITYLKLMDGHQDAQSVAGRTYEFFEFVEVLEKVSPPQGLTGSVLKGQRFGFHISCHQRPLGAGRQAMNFLRRRGAEVELLETGTCCGMAGTFGLKKGPLGYTLSQAIGDPLFQSFKAAGVGAIVTESSVCSIHLKEGTGLKVLHPLELVLED
jgi:Fe-S oxidoreductase